MYLKEVKNILASRIRTLRNSQGWTQEHLAEKIDVHATYISRIESCKKIPTLNIVCRIAKVLGVFIHELFVDEGNLNSYDYKRKKLINILNESTAGNIEVYSTVLDALHKKYGTKQRKNKVTF